jgi:hypothetical protein
MFFLGGVVDVDDAGGFFVGVAGRQAAPELGIPAYFIDEPVRTWKGSH